MKSVTYYLSLISPWTYLGSGILSRLAREQGVEIRCAVDLGRFSSNRRPAPAKAPPAYLRLQELNAGARPGAP